MRIQNQDHQSIHAGPDGRVTIIDQRLLPHRFERIPLDDLASACHAISDMAVRGAPLIGATAAWGLCLALRADPSDEALHSAAKALKATRPTAVNLAWAVDAALAAALPLAPAQRPAAAEAFARALCAEDIATNYALGQHGLAILQQRWQALGRPARLELLTHCNAGWLATVDWGTALAPIFAAHQAGLPVHVWVDETRPRNQGASLTAWELHEAGIPCTVIADNAGGHLMQQGRVHLCIVGTDRTTRTGDVANKIGTYLKALAAHDNQVPFWVALPSSTIDWALRDGLKEIPIEARHPDEVRTITGLAEGQAQPLTVRLVPEGVAAFNPAFDVTPARLVTGLITERGACPATEAGLLTLFPERR